MRVLEEPFTTRDAILAVLRPGLPATESPFRTLRRRRCASPGLRVEMRTRRGQMLGHAQLYSSLNGDAARAVRLGEDGIARELANRAEQLEQSPDAALLRAAVQAVGSGMSADPMQSDAPVALRRYIQLRRRMSLHPDSDVALERDWLVQSAAWLGAGERREVVEAVVALARGASEARADLLSDRIAQASVFYGVVRRMDATVAEIDGVEGEARLISRRDLELQGLAVLGEAVALHCEALPAGGTLVLPTPAVALEQPSRPMQGSPWDLEAEPDEGAVAGILMDPPDQRWIDRGYTREDTPVPVVPLPRR